MNNTFFKFSSQVEGFISFLLSENPDYIVPVKKKGCKLLKYANLDSTTMKNKVRYIDYFQNNERDLDNKKICVIDDATKYTSRLSHYREYFTEKGATVSTYSYIANKMLKNGEREQYDEKAIICKYLSESTYQEYLTQQSRVLIEESHSFDIDHFVVEIHLDENKYEALINELYKVGSIEYVNDKYTSKEIEKISIIDIDYFNTESMFDASVEQGALQKVRMTYNRKKRVLYIAPLSYPIWDSKKTNISEMFSSVRFELPYQMTEDITNEGIYFNLVYVFQIMLFKYFMNAINDNTLFHDYKVLDTDMVSYVGAERAEKVITSAMSFLSTTWMPSICQKRHEIKVPIKRREPFYSLKEVMNELRKHYDGLVKETQTLIGVRYYLAYEELIERYRGHENILKWIDILCDRGVLVTRNYNEQGVFYRACRSGETNFDFIEKKSGGFIFLAINVCGDEIKRDENLMCEVSPTYINKVMSNFVYDYPSEEYDCHSINTRPYNYGPLTYIEDKIDGYNEISLYKISAITKFCLYDECKRKFYAYSMKNESVRAKIDDIIGSQDDISFSEVVAYFDFIRIIKETQGSADFLNSLAICREEDIYYKHVRYNLDEAKKCVAGARNIQNIVQKEKYLREAAKLVNSARNKLGYNQRKVYEVIRDLEVPLICQQVKQKIMDSFEGYSDVFSNEVVPKLKRIQFNEFLIVNFELYINLYDIKYLRKALCQYVKQSDVQLDELHELVECYKDKEDCINISYDQIVSEITTVSNKLINMVQEDYSELIKIKPINKRNKISRKRIISNIRNWFNKSKYEKILIVSFSYSGYRNINDEKEVNVVNYVQNIASSVKVAGKLIVGQEENDFGVFVTNTLANAIDFSKKIWTCSSEMESVFYRMGCCMIDTVGCSISDIEKALMDSYQATRVIEGRNAFVLDGDTYQMLQDYENDNVYMSHITAINDEYYEYDKDKQKYMIKKYETNTDCSIKIGIITVLNEEYIAVSAMLENCFYVEFPGKGAGHQFRIGEIKGNDGGVHKVALAKTSGDGNNKAAIRAEKMIEHFPCIDVIFMVGIAGGTPALPIYANDHNIVKEKHVRLGDIVVSKGILQYDYIKKKTYSWQPKGNDIPPCSRVVEAQSNLSILAEQEEYPWHAYLDEAIGKLKSSYKRPSEDYDILHDYNGEIIEHPQDDGHTGLYPKVFNGKIASSNSVLKDPNKRDELKKKYDIYAIEMETSGIADATWESDIGYYGIRGICDYCDVFKNDKWHKYAALAAAAYTKAIIEWMST